MSKDKLPYRKHIAISHHAFSLLEDIEQNRKAENSLVNNKGAIVSGLIMDAHKKEIK